MVSDPGSRTGVQIKSENHLKAPRDQLNAEDAYKILYDLGIRTNWNCRNNSGLMLFEPG